MMRWIGYELKSLMTNKKNILIFVLVFLLHFTAFSFLNNDTDILSSKMSLLEEYNLNKDSYRGERYCEGNEAECLRQRQMDETTELWLYSMSEGDIESYNERLIVGKLRKANAIESYLLNLKHADNEYLKEKVEHYFYNRDIHLEYKQKVKDKYGFSETEEDIFTDPSVDLYNHAVDDLKYTYEVLDKGFELYHEPSKSSLTVVLSILRTYFMMLIVAVPLLVSFDAVSKDRKSGSLRTFMTLGINRKKYIMIKIISCYIVSMIILIVPLLIILLANGVNIVRDLSFPHFLYTDGLSSFKGLNPAVFSKDSGYAITYFSFQSRSLVTLNEFGFPIGINNGVTLQPLGYSLILIFMLVSLLVVFVLTLQISINVNTNKYSAFVFTVLILGILFYLTTLTPETFSMANSEGDMFPNYEFEVASWTKILNPLSYLNSVDVVEGTTAVTFMSGVLVLIVETVIIFTTGSRVFKVKDIKD